MEKLMYALWAEGGDGEAMGARLRSDIVPVLQGEGARYLSVAVADDRVAAGGELRIGSMPAAKDAMVSLWLPVSFDRSGVEAALSSVAERIAGYLVSESRPLVTPLTALGGPGEATDGFHLVTCLCSREDIDHDEFVRRWQGPFSEVAIGLQSTFDYVRNEVIRPLTLDAPPWEAIVEEGFPAKAITQRAAFFDADDAAILAEREQAMFEAVQQFLDLGSVESHPMSQYVYEAGPDVNQ